MAPGVIAETDRSEVVRSLPAITLDSRGGTLSIKGAASSTAGDGSMAKAVFAGGISSFSANRLARSPVIALSNY